MKSATSSNLISELICSCPTYMLQAVLFALIPLYERQNVLLIGSHTQQKKNTSFSLPYFNIYYCRLATHEEAFRFFTLNNVRFGILVYCNHDCCIVQYAYIYIYMYIYTQKMFNRLYIFIICIGHVLLCITTTILHIHWRKIHRFLTLPFLRFCQVLKWRSGWKWFFQILQNAFGFLELLAIGHSLKGPFWIYPNWLRRMVPAASIFMRATAVHSQLISWNIVPRTVEFQVFPSDKWQ